MPGSKTNKARKGVFISYAREDGTTFADLLRRKLKAEQIQLWRDREEMVGGRDWWLQIVEALNEVEFMALVVTPKALKSEIVRKEWRLARQEGVCVFPIKGSPDLDFASLPHWMSSSHFYDLGTAENDFDGPEWPRFVNDLNTRCQMRRVPFMVGDLPEGFIQRPDEFDRLHKLLCDPQREEPIAITAALRGAGGYGKTTLAKALCHDEQIQDVFDDGILWVTLGENPGNLTGLVEDLIVTLGDERPGFTTLDAAVNRFKELLADRDILLVIDDVWDRTHLNPFTQGGSRCARLITTRNLDTLPVKIERVKVDAMHTEEATSLLAAGLDYDPLNERERRRELTDLASRLGEWPLLLRLVNSALRNRIENDKQSSSDAVIWINKALTKRGLTYFDARNSDERHMAVARTIGVSIDLLSMNERERYGELAIFPEDVDIPLASLEKLWSRTGGFDEFDTEELCSRLNRFSLLWSYDANRRSIRLHDVVRKFLIEQQGSRLPSIHTQLLDALRPINSLTEDQCWAKMPSDEPYLWDYLAHHLVEAGRADELVTTVKDWRYLVAKTLIRRSLAVEADLVAASKIEVNDNALRLLRRNFVNSSHLLNRSENRSEIETTLFSRLQHLSELEWLTTNLKQDMKRPCLVVVSKLPDLPHPALVRTLSGHAGDVNGCTLSADGSTIVSASNDRTLKVWDGHSGVELFTLNGHAGEVTGCAISADGSTIVSASADQTLKVWDRQSGAERFALRGHTDVISDCAISEDGSTIVSASYDQTLKVWDALSGIECFTLVGHTDIVSGCALSADGTTLISASDDQTLKVWDVKTKKERFTLEGHANWVSDCAVSADGATIVSASFDQTLKVWDGLTGMLCSTLRGHTGVVSCCVVSPDGSTIVSGSRDRTLKVWDVQSGFEYFSLSGHAEGISGCAMSADETMIVSVSSDGMLKIWDGRSRLDSDAGGIRHTNTRSVRRCDVSGDGIIIVSASDDKTLKFWHWHGEMRTFKLIGSHANLVNGGAFSADGTMIVSASADQTLKIWDGLDGKELLTLSGHADVVSACAMSADGSAIISASADQTLKVWEGRSGQERFTLRGHTDIVSDCAVSADGLTIVSASADQTLKVWNAWKGLELLTLRGHADVVTSCALSADGASIVSASADHTLKVWDGRDGVERFTFRGHRDVVTGCAVTADGAIVMSTSEDHTLKVWDSVTGNCIATLHVDGALHDCDCSADGDVVVAAGVRGLYFLRLER